jgi:hypothetical protein
MGASWKEVIRGVAPALGTALGGPALGTALKFISTALLGKPDGTEAEIEQRIANWSAADELALRQAEQQFTLSLLDRVTASEQVDASDRASAREREKTLKDWTPQALALVTFGVFFLLLLVLIRHQIPATNQQAIDLLLGALIGAVTQILNYYFGSSSGSAAARTVIGRIAEAKQ